MAAAAVTTIMASMSLIVALFLAGSTAAPPATPPRATAVGVARARILAPAEARQIDGRLEVRTGDRRAPTQVHRTDRRDGGETADFY